MPAAYSPPPEARVQSSPTPAPPQPRSLSIIRLHRVMQKTGKSRPAIYAAMPRGQFPLSVSLGARAVGWIESEIDEWIESRIAKSRSEDYSAVAKLPQALRQRMQARKANEERN